MTFEELYTTYYNRVLKYICTHTDSVQDAEDLANNAFTICYEKFDTYDSSKASVSTWMYVIVNNMLKNYYRGKRDIVSLDDPDLNLCIRDTTDLDKAVELSQMRELIADALSALDEEKRRIVVLRYFSDRSMREISELTGYSEVNVRVILNRSLNKMRDYLKKKKTGWEF